MSNKPTDNGEDFILGTKAADLWLYTCDLCANDKIIPKKYRYTTGTCPMPRKRDDKSNRPKHHIQERTRPRQQFC